MSFRHTKWACPGVCENTIDVEYIYNIYSTSMENTNEYVLRGKNAILCVIQLTAIMQKVINGLMKKK